jgi:hypothetical protein
MQRGGELERGGGGGHKKRLILRVLPVKCVVREWRDTYISKLKRRDV